MIGCDHMPILNRIYSHDDLQDLTAQDQQILCQEIRHFLVDQVSHTGGHLASNLGVVELSVAIETVYDTRVDRLVFDVGHQSYVHKLLTGRQADFARLRQFGGMAGFPKPSESETDAFVAGHASSSVSIALGMARARTLSNENYDVIAVIGDGAATGGMAYEALNDAAVSREPMVIILNDNEMSIAPNVGGFAQHLSRLRSKESYLGLKKRYRRIMGRNAFSRAIYRASSKCKRWVKKILLQPTIFENMGLTYLGPVDGHDVQGLIGLLRIAREMRRPVLIHVHTQKGRGYGPAEENPSRFHGVGKFDAATGQSAGGSAVSFSMNFGDTMLALAEENPKVCAITAAMPEGTGLTEFMQKYPNRLFDVGIAEEHAVSMAGGLAKQGMVPVVALYSTFLQRSYDQILQDISMLKLHVVLAIDRAGLVGEDGETHHGVFDMGFLAQTPGMCVLCPGSLEEQQQMLSWAVKQCNGPVAVRYPRGGNSCLTASHWEPGKDVAVLRQGKDGAIITYGLLTCQALSAAEMLAQQGIEVAVIQILQAHPAPVAALDAALGDMQSILIAEEAIGGIARDVVWKLHEAMPSRRIAISDLGCEYIPHGSVSQLYEAYGLDARSLVKRFMEVYTHEN